MKETIKLILVPAIICLAAGLLLAGVYEYTEEPIKLEKKKEKLAALKVVLPPCDNDPYEDSRIIREKDVVWVFYVARLKGEYAGAAFESSAQGYGGEIGLMVGVDAAGKVVAIEILSAEKETPGLGARIGEPQFKTQFAGRPVDPAWCRVDKDGGAIVAVTGATISSRAVADAVAIGLDVLKRNLKTVEGTAESGK